jgi:hypothetical protein
LIQTLTSAGCIDALRFIPNVGVLPVRFTGFQAVATDAEQALLRWYVADNETGRQFVVERSSDGHSFSPVALIMSTQKSGSEQYEFKDLLGNGRAFYRIKLVDKNDKMSYTNILAVGNTIKTQGNLSLNQNPVESYLLFRLKSSETTAATVNIYNASGALVYSEKTNLTKDTNTVAINLDGKVFTGLYVLEVNTPFDHNSVKFIKR